MAYLQITDFYKDFGDVKVLKGVNVQVEKGEVLSIIGSSGSGKTTLLRCINFLETPDKGSMVLDGQELFSSDIEKKDTDEQLREKRLNFGLVFQSFNLFPQYTVVKNITLAPTLQLNDKIKQKNLELKKQGVKFFERRTRIAEYKATKKQEIENQALSLLETVGLTDKKDAYPCELSGGQCQRVAIARALALKPKVLCFDEPTSALDPELTGEVLRVIKSLKNQDRTMIIVTHEMGFAKNVSDKVVFMSEGEIVEYGTPEEIFTNPKNPTLKHFLSTVSNKEDA